MATTRVACTITGEIEFGSMCRNTIGPRLTPSARAASTWSDSRWASICPRSSRANTGICGIATAMITLVRFGLVNSTPIEIASSRLGMDSMTSTIRMMTVSTQPPNAPASMPRISPPISPISVARMPTSSVCLAPTIIRENRSRPWVSPPSGKPGCGGRDRVAGTGGLADQQLGARVVRRDPRPMIASTTNSPTITAPIQNSGETFSRDQASFSSDGALVAGVDQRVDALLARPRVGGDHQRVLIRGSTSGVGQVDDGVDDDEDRGRGQDQHLHAPG